MNTLLENADLVPTTLRPGWLVSLHTEITGNVKYFKETIEADHLTETGERKAVWTTERTINDPVEHEAASKARNRARNVLSSVCSKSKFGLLCPEGRTADLQRVTREARAIVNEFNASAQVSQIGFYVVTGRVASDDVEAINAINSQIRTLLAEMQEGVSNCDVKAIREAADTARQLGQMLEPIAADTLKEAIDAARKVARRIVDAGDNAAIEVDRLTMTRLGQARTAFLDLDAPGAILEPMNDSAEAFQAEVAAALPARPELDLDEPDAPPAPEQPTPAPAAPRDFDLFDAGDEPPAFLRKEWNTPPRELD